jgi:hypothetical protein
MGSTRHEKTFVDYDKTYEQNIIGLKGIVYFGIGLLLLIVITFALMFFLINVMEDQSRKEKDEMLPMQREAMENNRDAFLPPEPRLQVAPGFGVEGENGRVNLELRAPQSEWLELQKTWKSLLQNGQKKPSRDCFRKTLRRDPPNRDKKLWTNRARSYRIRAPVAWRMKREGREF